LQYSNSVQTTCDYCRAILVRHDLDLEKVGTVADLPPDVSPIQRLTEGIWNKQAFVVVGRIIYQYELGAWNEWHCVTNQGASLWLSDAMAQYAVSQLVSPAPALPASGAVRPGTRLEFGGASYEVSTLTRARYLGVEGELPFEYWDKQECLFADLRTADGRFGTIDYTEQPPLLFLGESVEFDSLRLKNLRQFEGW
jgi:hypothetical protein